MHMPMNVMLVAVVSLMSIVIVSIRQSVFNFGHRLDATGLPKLDQIVLWYFHAYDLRFLSIRIKSVTLLEVGKTLALFFILAVLACANSVYLGLIIALVVSSIFLATYWLPRAEQFSEWPSAKALLEPENYSELLLIIGLLVGFLFVLPKGTSPLNGTVILLLIARFSGQLRSLGRQLRNITRWRAYILRNVGEQLQKQPSKTV
jgi:hypothetical protein